ncbi:MAG: ferrous iron transport protein A [Bdellovibrionales bacterium]|nr:ferrous iron transport protein A [Bdellovibrionales bacterium]
MILNSESSEKLGTLTPGARAEIVGFGVSAEQMDFLIRLHEVGFIVGEHVEILGSAPMGRDPISIRIKDAVYALRREDADLVLVRRSGSA